MSSSNRDQDRLAVGVDIFSIFFIHYDGNPGTEDIHLIEVQTGDYFGEDDIERLEDIYGR